MRRSIREKKRKLLFEMYGVLLVISIVVLRMSPATVKDGVRSFVLTN